MINWTSIRDSMTPRSWIIVAAVVLATNAATGLITAKLTSARDFSEMNINCLLNWGLINANFEDADERKLPPHTVLDTAALYHMHEDNARFLVHYPKFNHRLGYDRNRTLDLFCWAVAAERYREENVDIEIDPAVWQAFLKYGPHDLPMYWSLRESLTTTGADTGMIRGSDHMNGLYGKKTVHKLARVSTPYKPLPGEGAYS